MIATTRLLLLLLIAVFGIGCEERPSSEGASDGSTSEAADETNDATNDATDAQDVSGVPAITFELLDQVRTVDLIDMELSFPESLRALDGQRVSLVGFMAPFDDLQDMRRCMIVPSYVGCKFCDPPNITQVVYVTRGDDRASPRSYPFIEPAALFSGILRLSLADSHHEGIEQGFVYSLEDAVVTVYAGDAPVRAASHGNTPHQPAAPKLEPVDPADLIREVADLIGRAPIAPIEVEPVSAESFAEAVRASLERTFPEATRSVRAKGFNQLGLLPVEVDWIEILTEYHLSQGVAVADAAGERVALLDTIRHENPYVRLELVGEIAAAIMRQHIPPGQMDTATDDVRRAHEAIRHGFRTLAISRYARVHGIPPGMRPPIRFVHESRVRRRGRNDIRRVWESVQFGNWFSLPSFIGSFFVDALVGDTGPISGVESALAEPPLTTMEFFRPRWHRDPSLWRQDPVPSDFADDLIDTPPVYTDVLGASGLVAFLSKWFAFDPAKTLAGGWAGDRWALWQFPDDTTALLLEIRWQDEESAIEFREAIPSDEPWRLLPHPSGSTQVRLLRADSAEVLDRLTAALQPSP